MTTIKEKGSDTGGYIESESLKFRKEQYEEKLAKSKGKPVSVQSLIDSSLFQAYMQTNQSNLKSSQSIKFDEERKIDLLKNQKEQSSLLVPGCDAFALAGKVGKVAGFGSGEIVDGGFVMMSKYLNDRRQGKIACFQSDASAAGSGRDSSQGGAGKDLNSAGQNINSASELSNSDLRARQGLVGG